jgi:hypothetical protein
MIIIAVNTQKNTQANQERLSVQTNDLNACPDAANESDFLNMMDGWL